MSLGRNSAMFPDYDNMTLTELRNTNIYKQSKFTSPKYKMNKSELVEALKQRSTTPSPTRKSRNSQNTPKRPTSSFMFWLMENRPKITKPGMGMKDVAILAGTTWNKLRNRSKWEKMAEADLVRYHDEMKHHVPDSKSRSVSRSVSRKRTPSTKAVPLIKYPSLPELPLTITLDMKDRILFRLKQLKIAYTILEDPIRHACEKAINIISENETLNTDEILHLKYIKTFFRHEISLAIFNLPSNVLETLLSDQKVIEYMENCKVLSS